MGTIDLKLIGILLG